MPAPANDPILFSNSYRPSTVGQDVEAKHAALVQAKAALDTANQNQAQAQSAYDAAKAAAKLAMQTQANGNASVAAFDQITLDPPTILP